MNATLYRLLMAIEADRTVARINEAKACIAHYLTLADEAEP
jgi:hypothetical protein